MSDAAFTILLNRPDPFQIVEAVPVSAEIDVLALYIFHFVLQVRRNTPTPSLPLTVTSPSTVASASSQALTPML